MSLPKLYYFDAYGRAEAIRILLHEAKVEFEDVRLDGAAFGKLAAEGFATNGVPIYVSAEGNKYNQSAAILRYLGSLHGLYSSVPFERYWDDWTIETIKDAFTDKFLGLLFVPSLAEEQIKDAVEAFTWFADQIEGRLTSNEGKHFIGGDKLSIGDILILSTLHSIAFNDGLTVPALGEALKHVVASKPHFAQYHERLAAHFADYFAARPHPRPF